MGTAELLIILALALIVIGPRKLPELARSLGKGLGEFKRATREFREPLYRSDTAEAPGTPSGEPAPAEPEQPAATSTQHPD
jgi:TatA/E family protein of Tat protein translocase